MRNNPMHMDLGKAPYPFHDWIFHPTFGFFKQTGYYMEKMQLYDEVKMLNGGPECQINFVHLSTGHGIQFPFLTLLCIIGIIIGLIGFIKFCKHSFKLALSFLFFMVMNISGLFFHSLLPFASEHRTVFGFLDKASTGISGLFLSWQLISMLSSTNTKDLSQANHGLHYAVIILGAFALSNVDILAECTYVFGCVSVFVACGYILFRPKTNKYLSNIGRLCGGLYMLVVTVISTGFGSFLCESTSGVLNMMAIFFAISDIGFAVCLYYLLKYYQQAGIEKEKKQ
eukprot:219927_1